MRQRAETIGSILNRTLARLGITAKLKELEAVRRFKEIVGERIAQQAEAVAIKDGRLQVRVSSPAWRQELTYSKQEIIDSLNSALGEKVVTDIHFTG